MSCNPFPLTEPTALGVEVQQISGGSRTGGRAGVWATPGRRGGGSGGGIDSR